MCSSEEFQKIVAESEARQQAKLEKSHMAIAKSISDWGMQIKEDRDTNRKEHVALTTKLDKLDKLDTEAINKVSKIFNSATTVGALSSGIAKFIMSMTAIFAGGAYVIKVLMMK